MDAPITHETLAHVIASLGMHGYWPHPKGDTGVEYSIYTADHVPAVAIEMDLQAPSLKVRLATHEFTVTSVFDNGSGVCFRGIGHEWSSEFLSLDHQSGTISVTLRNMQNFPLVIKTPFGERNDAHQRQIDSLREQIPAKESDNEFSYI